MDEALELGNYLPLSYKSPKEQEYIAFLWDNFEKGLIGFGKDIHLAMIECDLSKMSPYV